MILGWQDVKNHLKEHKIPELDSYKHEDSEEIIANFIDCPFDELAICILQNFCLGDLIEDMPNLKDLD